MSDLASYYLGASPAVIEFETIEIRHSALDPLYLVRNKKPSLTATLETGEDATFVFCPMSLRKSAVQDDMSLSMQVDLADLGTEVPQRIRAIRAAAGLGEKPKAVFRTWRSDNLDEVLQGPIVLEIPSIPRNKTGASLVMRAPRLNLNRTGLRYSVETMPMLRSLL